MKLTRLLSFFLLITSSVLSQPDSTRDKRLTRILSPAEMQEDWTFLRRVLWETHPGLFRYTPRQTMEKKADSIAGLLNRPLAFYEYYGLVAGLIADIRCAHTYAVPHPDINSYISEIKSLPFQVMISGERVYVTVSGATDTTIRPGLELLSIDQIPVRTILQRLYAKTWADGYSQSFKRRLVSDDAFSFFYYALVARPDTFRLQFREPNGKQFTRYVPAISPMVYHPYYGNNPVNRSIIAIHAERNRKDREQPWRIEYPGAPGVAVLRIKSFGGGNNGAEAAAKMRAFMDTSMIALKEKKIEHLIVDLRYNGGGWDIQGIELFTYLMKDTTPVRYYARKHSITDSSEFIRFSDLSTEDRANIKKELIPETDGTFTIKEEFNEDLKLQYPKPNRFTGKIYFLVNGNSASTTSEFAAVAHSHRLGVFIGEETGGAYEGGNGGSFLHFQLPNSGIALGTPLLYYQNGVKKPAQRGRGVIPDHPVELTRDDVLKGNDPAMKKAMELIRKR